jgi:hypothetical protein
MSKPLNCPSAQPNQNARAVIGVVCTQDGRSQVSLLPHPVSLDSVAQLIPDTIPMTEVLRLAGPCAEGGCSHFSDHRCTLASRIVARLPAAVDRLPHCGFRPSCRWWHQEGQAACHRCTQIVTEPFRTSELMRELATPDTFPTTPTTSTTGGFNHV